MDIKDTNEPTDQPKQTPEVKEETFNPKTNEELNEANPGRKNRKQATEKQLSNPFHGVKLAHILESVVEHYGWEYLAKKVKIRCFIYNPTMKSSLGFLRKTQWAREFVEDIYLDMLDEKKAKEKKD
tara:strand:- start:2007 stop:2384 length:378 start_codon:yes stop_codon:yes gene_type:complete